MARQDNLSNYLTDVATAIKNKKGDQTPIVAGNFDTEITNLVLKNNLEEKDVNFYDYDGTLVYSCTKTEFLNMQQMPNNPTHEGLTAQGWNWTFENAQDYVSKYGILDVGQMYVTDDNTIRVYISLIEDALSPYLGFGTNGTVTIDWGDGSTEQRTGTSITSANIRVQHTYSQAGDYVIKFSCESDKQIYLGGFNFGTWLLSNNNGSNINDNGIYTNTIKKVETSSNTILGQYVFNYTYSIKNILISKGTVINDNVSFTYCSSLRALIIPNNITTITSDFYKGNSNPPFAELEHFILPDTISTFSNNMRYSAIKRLIVPPNVSSLPQHFCQDCTNLKEIVFPSSIATIPAYACFECYNLSKIILGEGLLSFENQSSTFGYCGSIREINLPDTLTKLSGFYNSPGIAKVVMPRDLDEIYNFTFRYAWAFYWDFSKTTQIPALDGGYDIGIPSKNIIVPDELYDDWIVATNWSSYASKIIKASEWEEQNA